MKSNTSQRQILVTAALPYANGHIHIGNMLEHIQTNIWVRFQKLRGQRCLSICADDTHGTAIMISAQQQGIREEDLIARMQKAHIDDITGFEIEFDNYGSTHSEENRELCAEIWAAMRKAGLVHEKEVSQLFDAQAGTFLADRQVKGTCPRCGAEGQYGDNCDKCGATYSPGDLINPTSAFTGTTPEVRRSPHLFIKLEELHDFLDRWTQSGGHLQPEVANYLKGHFLGEPLRDWDISRPAPYFGFEIPDSPGNYWYVWFDAPIGYISITANHTDEWEKWWKNPDGVDLFQFIGKDNIPFHTVIFPSSLLGSGKNWTMLHHMSSTEYLNYESGKFSKSKGIGVFVRRRTGGFEIRLPLLIFLTVWIFLVEPAEGYTQVPQEWRIS